MSENLSREKKEETLATCRIRHFPAKKRKNKAEKFQSKRRRNGTRTAIHPGTEISFIVVEFYAARTRI